MAHPAKLAIDIEPLIKRHHAVPIRSPDHPGRSISLQIIGVWREELDTSKATMSSPPRVHMVSFNPRKLRSFSLRSRVVLLWSLVEILHFVVVCRLSCEPLILG